MTSRFFKALAKQRTFINIITDCILCNPRCIVPVLDINYLFKDVQIKYGLSLYVMQYSKSVVLAIF